MARVKAAIDKVASQESLARQHRAKQAYERFGTAPPKVFSRGPWKVYQYPSDSWNGPFAVVEDKAGHVAVSAPTDKHGNIPKDIAILRLITEEEGGRSGRKRSAMIDIGIEASEKAKLRGKSEDDRLAQYLWYMAPNESDLAKVDTPDADWALPKAKGKRPAAVAILGAKPHEAEGIRKVIDRSFTNHEKKLMRGLVIEVKSSAGKGLGGFYQKARGHLNIDLIVIQRDSLYQNPPRNGPLTGETAYDSVLIHELLHFLRAHDKKRSGAAARTPGDKDLEEVFTDAETVARMKTPPWERRGDGYYTGDMNQRFESATHDRQLLLNVRDGEEPKHDSEAMNRAGRRVTRLGRDVDRAARAEKIPAADLRKMWKGKKGLQAINATEERFPHLEVAKAKVEGRAEAVDTYWRLRGESPGGKGQTIETHIYSPDGNPNVQALHKIAAPIEGELHEFQDGVEVPVVKADGDVSYQTARRRSAEAADIASRATRLASRLLPRKSGSRRNTRRRGASKAAVERGLRTPGRAPKVMVVTR